MAHNLTKYVWTSEGMEPDLFGEWLDECDVYDTIDKLEQELVESKEYAEGLEREMEELYEEVKEL